MADLRPIGIFDSGLGGLTVLKAVRKLLPNENIIYFGDNGRTPYGTKSHETIRKYTLQDIRLLKSMNVKAVVIACNTAAASCDEELRKQFNLPIIDVIEAGAEEAARVSKSGRVGVIGTNATVKSGVYERAVTEKISGCAFYAKACPLFVPLVEEGWWNHEVTAMVAHEYLDELKAAHVDTLVLGCTHYPYLAEVIGTEMGPNCTLVNSAEAVAKKVSKMLMDNDLINNSGNSGSVKYYTSDSVKKFIQLGSMFLGEKTENVERATASDDD